MPTFSMTNAFSLDDIDSDETIEETFMLLVRDMRDEYDGDYRDVAYVSHTVDADRNVNVAYTADIELPA